MNNDQPPLARGRHCMVVHNTYPLGEPRVERDAQALIRHGYEVDVICLREIGEPAVGVAEGVNVYRLPVRRDKRRGAAAQLVEYLAFFVLAFFKLISLHRRKYGVVQVHNLPDFLVYATLWPRLTGARIILDIHDVMPEFYAARFKRSMDSWPVRLVRWQEQLSCRYAHHVITVTELWRQALIKRGVRDDKISVVMNVADERIFQRLPTAGPRSISGDRFKLIYHGSISQRYGLDLLVRAVDLVRQKIPGIHLTIHGGGEYRDTVMQLVKQLQLQDYVYFSVDKLPMAELPKLIAQADVGVIPYRRDVFTDGILPTKLMEYMALGVPAIAARTPVIADYFDQTQVEFFTPEDINDLAEHIYALYSNPARLNELAVNTAKFNQQYNWASQAAGYTQLVDRLAQKIYPKRTRG